MVWLQHCKVQALRNVLVPLYKGIYAFHLFRDPPTAHFPQSTTTTATTKL